MLSRLLTVREQWLLLGLAGAIILGSGVLIWIRLQATEPRDDYIPVRETVAKTASSSTEDEAVAVAETLPAPPVKIGVGILGAVEREGLYYFDEGARVGDLIDAAGGILAEGDLSDINRTALLIDETTLLVPEWIDDGRGAYSFPAITYNPSAYTRSAWYQSDGRDGTATSPATPGAQAAVASSSGLVNINTASQSELEALPGVGPATAQKIIAYRQSQAFTTPEDLEKVSGIGPAKMAAVRALITVN